MLEELAGMHPAVHADRLRRNEPVRYERVYDLRYPLGLSEPADRHSCDELLARILVAR